MKNLLVRSNPPIFNTKFSLSLVTFFSLFLISLSLPISRVSAQSVGLSISPPQVEILLQPNTRVIQAFNIQNQGESINLTPSISRIVPTDTFGHTAIDENPLNMADTGLTITILNEDIKFGEAFALPKDGSTQIVLRIESSATTDPIDNYLALTLTSSISDESNTPSTAPKIASLIFISTLPLDTQPISLEIEDFALPSVHDSTRPLTISPIIANTSNIMIRPTGKISLKNYRGITILEQSLYPHLILGNTSRSLQGLNEDTGVPTAEDIIIENHFLIGPYTVELTLTTQSGKEILTDSHNIFMLPIQIIVYILIVIIMFLIVFSQIRRNQV